MSAPAVDWDSLRTFDNEPYESLYQVTNGRYVLLREVRELLASAQAVAPAQVEQEPVAWLCPTDEETGPAFLSIAPKTHDHVKDALRAFPVYAHPQAAQTAAQVAGLTDIEIERVYAESTQQPLRRQDFELVRKFARAILAAKSVPADGGGA